jgi:hypothetical protein
MESADTVHLVYRANSHPVQPQAAKYPNWGLVQTHRYSTCMLHIGHPSGFCRCYITACTLGSEIGIFVMHSYDDAAWYISFPNGRCVRPLVQPTIESPWTEKRPGCVTYRLSSSESVERTARVVCHKSVRRFASDHTILSYRPQVG